MAIFVLDEARVLDVNDALTTATGRHCEEIAGHCEAELETSGKQSCICDLHQDRRLLVEHGHRLDA